MATSSEIDAPVALESILFTEELNQRPSRLPDYETENRALVALARALADSPPTVLQTLADTILKVLRCDSAGVSLVTEDGKRFYWPAIAGVWKPHLGGGTPRDFGPCGDVLDRDSPLLFKHLERRYTYFLAVTPSVNECLLVPFYVEGKPVGTIWAIAHDDRRKFDNEDLRQLVSLSWFASSAYQARVALATLEEHCAARAGLAAIVDSSADAIFSKTLDGIITSWNRAAERMFGYTIAEAMGQQLTLMSPTERRAEEDDVLIRLRRGEKVEHFKTERYAKDGGRVSISLTISPIRNTLGDIIGASMVARDIGERDRLEAALKKSEVRYRRLFEAAHDGILILNTGTRKITDVNPFMLQLLDYPREHFIGKELWEIGIFRDKAANQNAMQELHEKGSIRFEDLPLQDRNGHRHPVEIVANIYQEGSEPVIQCNIRDIGDRVRFEREREALLVNEQAARMEAEAANRSKDLFLATLSHEVRTPLNAILGWATILRTGKCDAADLQEGMEVIERNCKAQAQLIEDVLDVSRIVSGKLRLEIRPCELVDVIKAAIDVVRPAAEAKHITIETALDAQASHVSCDKNRMQQVIWNMLTNAIKFTPQGKTVRVTLARHQSSAQMQISDEGQGISPEFLPYVFDRFRQADSTTQRKFGGLGLGLSIVKHIVEMHGGRVQAESAGEGRGATFTVNLPIRAVQLDEGDSETGGKLRDTESPDLTPIRLDGIRVLVVDDEEDARRLLVKVLGEAGGVVTAAGSVGEAMAAVTTANPHVLLSDIAMPDRDGYDLIRNIRSTGRSAKELPAVALTAFAHKDERLRVLRAGFQVHVAKPIDPHELIAVVATLAGRVG